MLWMFKSAQGGTAEAAAPFVAEFVGTFILAFTYGVCGAIGDETWSATAVASVLLAMTYGLAPISGGYFNPAVALANWLSGPLPWKRALMYMLVQILAGLAGGLANWTTLEYAAKVGPRNSFSLSQAAIAETIYCAMLCLAHLSCVTCLRNNPKFDENHFSGLAVGFVVIAGGYSVTDVSGAIFNPAIALGLDATGLGASGPGPLQFVSFHLVGAVLAAVLFRLCWRKEPLQGRTLQVRIVAVHHMRRQGSGFLGDTPDPYVVARWGEIEKRTSTVKHSLNATWSSDNELFMGGADLSEESKLRFEVMNENIAKDTSLGHLDVDLSQMPLAEWQHVKESLAEGHGADLEVQVMLLEQDPVAEQAHHGSLEIRMGNRLMCELLGTFLIVLTMGLSAITGSDAAPWSVAAALMTMVYSFAYVSGGHFNPAVTLGVVLSGRGVCGLGQGIAYWFAQIIGGILAGFVCVAFQLDATRQSDPFELEKVCMTEVLFTLMLVLVVLAVATTSSQPSVTAQNMPVGLAIGGCVVAGGFATGTLMNPAAVWGIAAATATWTGAVTSVPLLSCMQVSSLELVGGILAALIFRVAFAHEYHVAEEEAQEYEEEY